jgi:uncharacterized protein
MIKLVSYLLLGLGSTVAQTSTPALQSPPQESAKAAPMGAQELSGLQASADDGDAKTALGEAYQEGNGVSPNDALAAKWFRKAADQGDADADNKLGNTYRTGEGVERDKEEAVRCIERRRSKAMPTQGLTWERAITTAMV